ncbi:hypothetical protein BSIN_1480 [Burkholderia singularis]|uniref:Uncharacterized protein n=1 Tax=Burkholderia singularis TaxID=1503053 RepID=A0A238GYZ2_9BURK|nr:hypothetical protein BSIN_1480 [Burkholderia singularis]
MQAVLFAHWRLVVIGRPPVRSKPLRIAREGEAAISQPGYRPRRGGGLRPSS